MANETSTTGGLTTSVSILSDIRTKFILYFSIPFIVINIIGNVLNTIVFFQKKFRNTSSGFYFAILSIFDILQSYLVFASFLQQINIKIENLSDFTCKLHKYLNPSLPMFPGWILVLIAVDRFFLASFVKAGTTLKNKRIQILLITILLIAVTSINTINFKIFSLKPIKANSSIYSCMPSVEDSDFATTFNIYNCFLGTSFIPFGLMSFTNILTIRRLILSKKQALKNYSNMTKEVRFATTILTMNIIFIIFYLPPCITRICVILEPTNNFLLNNHDLNSLVMNFFVYVRHTHSSIQIFFYIGVNKIFKNELIRLLSSSIPGMKFLNKYTTTITSDLKSKSKTDSKEKIIKKEENSI